MTYRVFIEIHGKSVQVGTISEKKFRYEKSYLENKSGGAISVSLPLREEPYSEAQTQCFFDGLLPEGFTRRSVANWMHVAEDDYLSILAGLGKECLGAIRIDDETEQDEPHYRKLTLPEVKALAAEGATKSAKIVTESHLSLTGASGKVGLYLDRDNAAWYQPYGTAPSTHIVKQSHIRLNHIVVNEWLCLKTAEKCGIPSVESFIINTGGHEDGDVLYAAKRYDRILRPNGPMIDDLPVPMRLHQEDFAQAMGVTSFDKYESEASSYLRNMFMIIKAHSLNPLEDQFRLWDLVIFNYLVGNTDNHLKNCSLLYNEDLTGLRLAPAYDLVSTVIYRAGTRRLSMKIGDADTIDGVTENSFRLAAREAGLGERMAMGRYRRMTEIFDKALEEATAELAALGYAQAVEIKNAIRSRGL